MRSDDELLSHIRTETGVRRQRRQRVVAGAATAVVVLLLGAGALAAAGGDADESVHAEDGGTTTTEPTTTTATETTTTTEAATTTSTTSTTAPPATEPAPTTTEAPTTTTQPPIAPVSQTSLGDGVTLTVTATQDRARPGQVTLAIRIESPYGSGPAGFVDWDTTTGSELVDEDYDGFGAWEENVPLDCLGDEIDPETGETAPLGPDVDAGPVDASFTKTFTYTDTGPVTLRVNGNTSECTDDGSYTSLQLTVAVGG